MSSSEKRKLSVPIGAALLQGASNYPKGLLDDLIERKSLQKMTPMLQGKKFKPKGLFKGKSLGRAAGTSAMSAVTFPVFAAGVKRLSTAKTPKEKAKGLGLIAASSAIYGGGKGGIEAFVAAKGRGKGLKAAIKGMKGVGSTRSATSALHALAIASTIAGSRKRGEKPSKSMARAATIGALIGGAKGSAEILGPRLYARAKGRPANLSKLVRRRAVSAGLGRAGASAVGAVVLDRLLAGMMKKSSQEKQARFKALAIATGVSAGALGAYAAIKPMQVPVRGGVLQMNRGTFRQVKRAVKRKDPMHAASIVQRGLRSGRVKYHKYPSSVTTTLGLAKRAATKSPKELWFPPTAWDKIISESSPTLRGAARGSRSASNLGRSKGPLVGSYSGSGWSDVGKSRRVVKPKKAPIGERSPVLRFLKNLRKPAQDPKLVTTQRQVRPSPTSLGRISPSSARRPPKGSQPRISPSGKPSAKDLLRMLHGGEAVVQGGPSRKGGDGRGSAPKKTLNLGTSRKRITAVDRLGRYLHKSPGASAVFTLATLVGLGYTYTTAKKVMRSLKAAQQPQPVGQGQYMQQGARY